MKRIALALLISTSPACAGDFREQQDHRILQELLRQQQNTQNNVTIYPNYNFVSPGQAANEQFYGRYHEFDGNQCWAGGGENC